jgi:drug/metabolite transporter (DMT)-like permease
MGDSPPPDFTDALPSAPVSEADAPAFDHVAAIAPPKRAHGTHRFALDTAQYTRAEQLRAHLALLASRVITAYLLLLTSFAVEEMSSAVITELRFLISIPAYAVAVHGVQRQPVPPIGRRLALLFLACGVLSVLGPLCMAVSVDLATVTIVGIATGTRAVWALVFSVLTGVERLTPARAASVLMAIVGVAVVLEVWHGLDSAGSSDALGFLVSMAGQAAVGLGKSIQHVFFSPPYSLPPMVANLYGQIISGAILCALVAAPYLPAFWASRAAISSIAWGAVLYGGIVSNFVSWSLMAAGNKVLGPSTASLYECAQPFLSAIVGFVHLGETPTVFQALGGAIIVLSVLVNQAPSSRPCARVRAHDRHVLGDLEAANELPAPLDDAPAAKPDSAPVLDLSDAGVSDSGEPESEGGHSAETAEPEAVVAPDGSEHSSSTPSGSQPSP